MAAITLTQMQSSALLTHVQQVTVVTGTFMKFILRSNVLPGTCQVLCWNALNISTSPGDPNLAAAQFTSKHAATAHSATDTAISLQTVPASHTEPRVHSRSNYRTISSFQELYVKTSWEKCWKNSFPWPTPTQNKKKRKLKQEAAVTI